MNSPKFQLGDRVQVIGSSVTGTVSGILDDLDHPIQVTYRQEQGTTTLGYFRPEELQSAPGAPDAPEEDPAPIPNNIIPPPTTDH